MRFVMINLLLVCLLLLGITYLSFSHPETAPAPHAQSDVDTPESPSELSDVEKENRLADQHFNKFLELLPTDPEAARKELDAHVAVLFQVHPLTKELKELLFRMASEGEATVSDVIRLTEIKHQIRTDMDPEKYAAEIKMLADGLEQTKLVAKMFERDGKTDKKIPINFHNTKDDRDKPKNTADAPGASYRAFIGKPAADFQVIDLKGQELSLKKQRGKVVLLDFWATWCIPCKVEMPHIKKVYDRYKHQKFEVIGISLDHVKSDLEAYIEEENITWTQFLDTEGTVAKMYNVKGIPATFLIDGEGVVRKVELRGSALETAVAELVAENLAKQTASGSSDSIPATIPKLGSLETQLPIPQDKTDDTALEAPYDVEVVKAGFADYNAYLETDPARAYQRLDDAFREQYGDDPDVDILVQHIKNCNDGVETVDGAVKNGEAMVRLVSKLPTPPEAIEAINLHLEYLKEMQRKAREAGIDAVKYDSRHTIGQ